MNIGDINIANLCVGDVQALSACVGDVVVWPTEQEDPMLRTPLTLKCTALDSYYNGFYLSIEDDNYGTPVSAETYTKNLYYSKNGGPLVELSDWKQHSPELSNSGVLIDDNVQVGDEYAFYGPSEGNGGLGTGDTASTNIIACERFRTSHKFLVYGNINSLLTDKAHFDRFAAGDETASTFYMAPFAFYKLFEEKYRFSFDDGNGKKLVLPSTNLSTKCYSYMFNYCSGMTTAPELPATNLATGCYYGMFARCTLLANAPVLPATTLTESCYYGMFSGCTSLRTAPELPATTLADACYHSMFVSCTTLTSAPELLAQVYATSAYTNMFSGCSSLNYVKCLLEGTDIDIRWLRGVSSTGTFVKHPDSTWLKNASSYSVTGRIPYGWTVEDAVL